MMSSNLNIREKEILEILDKNDVVDNLSLSQMLGCSVVSIRTYIRNLEKEGKLIRTHGGAKKRPDGLTITIPSGNVYQQYESKTKIALHAYQYIENRDTIILDDSSTSYHLAKVIKKMSDKYLIIITNSLSVACELTNVKNIEVVMLGGLISGNLPASMGEFTINMLKELKAAKAFIGVHGINPEIGITSIGNNQMQIKKLIFDISYQVYVLATSNKFIRSQLLIAAPLSKVTRIITDDSVSNEIVQEIRKSTMIDIA